MTSKKRITFDPSFARALPSLPPPTDHPPPVPPLELTVLSWNIHGLSSKGMAGCRNRLVPRVIATINPDVIMLQENYTKIILDDIIGHCNIKNDRRYSWIAADTEEEAKVLYDSNLFEPCTRKGMPTERAERVDISAFAQEIFPNEGARKLRTGQVDSRVDLFSYRAVAVRLRHKTTKNVLILISFHNLNTKGSEEMASAFCKIVHRMSENEKTLVIGGADLNCTRHNFYEDIASVPDYDTTDRRKRKDKIDYFVWDKPGNITVEGDPRPIALDIFPPANDQEHPFQQVFRDLRGKVEIYERSLDHDPLVYHRLRVSYHRR